MVARFSVAAVVSVVLVAAAGVWMAWIVLPVARGDLVSTGYGLALLTKVALVADRGAPRRVQQPPAGAGDAAPAPRRPTGAGTSPASCVSSSAVLLAVVAVTAVLVARSPVSSTSAAPPAPTLPGRRRSRSR